MSARWNQAQFEAHQRRHGFSQAIAQTVPERPQPSQVHKAEVRAEKALQDEFESWLRQHDYLYRREPMHRATTAPLGWPDFTVCLPDGRVVFVEYKTATGQLSPEQTDWHRRAQEKGVAVFVSRSLQFSIDMLRQIGGQP